MSKNKDSNVINGEFKNYKKNSVARIKCIIRIMAVIGSILMLTSLIGSIIIYLL